MAVEDEKQEVTIVDIKIPFFSMVVFMVKLAIASIPAFIILTMISIALISLIEGIFYMLSPWTTWNDFVFPK